MKEFIEFKDLEGDRFSIRTGYTIFVIDNGDGSTTLSVDHSNEVRLFDTSEPYDQVIAKFEASEQVETPVVERFTKEEYRLLNKVIYELVCESPVAEGIGDQTLVGLYKKLQDVVKESEEE